MLRLHERHEREVETIIEAFFALYGLDPARDYYSHLCPPSYSNKTHVILDVHCKTVPSVSANIVSMEHKVYKVDKVDKDEGSTL